MGDPLAHRHYVNGGGTRVVLELILDIPTYAGCRNHLDRNESKCMYTTRIQHRTGQRSLVVSKITVGLRTTPTCLNVAEPAAVTADTGTEKYCWR
jgi:hypothetical protein